MNYTQYFKKMEHIQTIKNIFKINPLVYVFIVLSILTASFREVFIISFLIIIHELGHTIIAYILGIKINEIYIYPLGGISKFNMDLNISIKKELLILINGPIFQHIAYLLLLVLIPTKKDLINTYHYSILMFNLLPIYPLDGGKLVKLFLNKIISYKSSLKLIIYLSYLVTILLLLISKKSINTYIMISFLLILITKEKNKIDYIYNKYLLERYLNNYSFKKNKIIYNINNLYRDKYHLIYINNKYILEKDYLNEIYMI